MPQKFLHLNCFFTCGITPSNFATFCSILFTHAGATGARVISVSLLRSIRSLIAFASSHFFDLPIAEYGPASDATDDTPNQNPAGTRICWRGPAVPTGVRGATACTS